MASSSYLQSLFSDGVNYLKDSIYARENEVVYAKLPIEPFSRQIRIVTLWPGKFEEEVRCSLKVDVWTESYDALSYCWGKKHPTHQIKVNGKSFRVTEALYMALKYLRLTDGYIELWIDAICINQRNLAERSLQVPRMARIYSYAEQVIVWLGEPKDTISAGFKVIHELSLAEDEELFRHIWKRNKHRTHTLEAVWQLPWWSRIWVIQEVVAAKSAKVCIGYEVLDWDDFARVVLQMGAKIEGRNQSSKFKGTHQFVDFVKSVRGTESHLVQQTLLELVQAFRGRQAADPRDKIYGLMGMSGEAFKNGFLPDYSMSTSKCYTAFVKKSLDQSDDLYLLSSGEYHSSSKLELPSWCTDWTIDTSLPSPIWRKVPSEDGSIPQAFSASGTTKADIQFPDQGSLKVRGFVIDRIKTLGEAATDDQIWAVVKSWVLLAPPQDPDAFVRVISGGHLVFEDSSCSPAIIEAIGAEKLKSELSHSILDTCAHRRFVVTQEGHMGVVPKDTKHDDLVCILLGAAIPLVVRVADGFYTFVGQSYIDGSMQYNGDLGDDARAGRVTLQDFLLK